MNYQPMLELLAYLRANGFKAYIVSGDGIEFIRPWTETVDGFPPEQVIGSTVKLRFGFCHGTPVLVNLRAADKESKPVVIQTHTVRRPIANGRTTASHR
jgi:hypothetical protein